MENEPKEVYAAINRVAKALSASGIGKDSKNTQQGYNFRGIDAVHCTLGPILAREGLAVLPHVYNRKQEQRTTKSGGTLFSVTVEVEYYLVSIKDGSSHVVRFVGEGMDTADKATNKAMSAAYKYMAIQTFCIPTDGQDDADFTTHEEVQAPKGVDPQQARNEWKPKAEAAIEAHKAMLDANPDVKEYIDACVSDGLWQDAFNYLNQGQ